MEQSLLTYEKIDLNVELHIFKIYYLTNLNFVKAFHLIHEPT